MCKETRHGDRCRSLKKPKQEVLSSAHLVTGGRRAREVQPRAVQGRDLSELGGLSMDGGKMCSVTNANS